LNIGFSFTESENKYANESYCCWQKSIFNKLLKTETIGLEKLTDYRVLIGKAQSGTGGTAGTIYDVTGLAKGTGGENLSQFNLNATTDYVYVGSKES